MGVRGLWKVVEPAARPALLENLRGKVLAIDASIWIYHFIKAMRDPAGNLLRAAHVVGFFRRICKLLFYDIKPVFIFDGAAPILKKRTTAKRKERRLDREETAKTTANRLLTLQLQRLAQNDGKSSIKVKGSIPENATYMDKSTPGEFKKADQFHLPDMDSMAMRGDDQRFLSQEDLDDYMKQFSIGVEKGIIETSSLNFSSPEFAKLPLAAQYQLVSAARKKSRLRMGYTADQLDSMFPNRMEFSKFQVDRVSQRNFLTQRLMGLAGLDEDLTKKVLSEKNKDYMLKRNEQGWTLSLENRDKQRESPVKHESDSDQFEEVDIEPENATEPRESPQEQEPQLAQKDSIAELFVESSDDEGGLDQVFGFESKVQREKLHQSTKSIPTPRAGPSSFKFSMPVTKTAEAPVTKPKAKPKEKETEVPPWFELGESEFQSMEVPDRESDYLMPLEQAKYLQEEPAPAKKRRIGEREPEFAQGDAPPEPSVESRELAVESQETRPVEFDESFEQPQDASPEQSEESVSVPVEPAHVETSASPQETEPEAPIENISEAQTSTSETLTPTTGSAQNRSEGPAVRDPYPRQSSPDWDLAEAEEEEAEEDRARRLELAEEDALVEEDEDQVLAEMLIGETEENERFHRNALNILTDASKYQEEIGLLRDKFSKEKRDSDNVTEEMVEECQQLLQVFGIPYITAPMEAEAQCARLQDLNLVDGIVTDDGDALLFGQVTIYRNMFTLSKYVERYETKTIESELGLDRNKLISLAFLLGSDYTDGILGIGPVHGVELLAEFGNLKSFKAWWEDVQRFPTDDRLGTKFRRQFYKRFKSKLFLPDEFPDAAVADAYHNPVVDPDESKFQWATPDLDGLRQFLEATVGWSHEQTDRFVLPVLEESRRQALLQRTQQTQPTLDKFYAQQTVNRSTRAKKATEKIVHNVSGS